MVLLNYLQEVFNSLPKDNNLNLPACKQNALEIEFTEDDETNVMYSGSVPNLPFACSDVFQARIAHWRRLTAVDAGCKAVYEVTFDVQDSNFSFKAGDTIGIIPRNDSADVYAIIKHLDLTSQAELSYSLTVGSQKGKVPPHIPVKSTIRHVLTHCVDLRSVLKKLFLLALSKHTKDENERRALQYFCSKEGSSAYQTHILDRNLCLLDIFNIFQSCKPPIQVLLANLPRLLPRPYSIVNRGLKDANLLKICFSVMPLANKRKGLTTGWLEKIFLNEDLENRMSELNLNNDCDIEKVPIYLRKNLTGFLLPENTETPLILIGPGTGVAPFIGFLEEREFLRNKNQSAIPGDVWLFFGCRNPKLDFIYKKELNDFLSSGTLKKLCTAFSRVDNIDVKYIQDALIQNSEEIAKLIESNASIFVCGELKNMAAQVKDAIIQCLINTGKSQEEAENVVSTMQRDNRYFIDAWS